MKLFVRIILSLLVLLSAGAAYAVLLTKRPIDVAAYPQVFSPPPEGAPVAGLKFSILPTATAAAPEGAIVEGGSWLRRRTLTHSAVLICHPQGLVLFDTGLGRDIDSQFSEFPLTTRCMLTYRKLAPAADIVAADNPCPGRPVIIIPSHLHWDHAGGIEDFPDAEVWVRAEELEQARSGGVEQGFLPGEIDSTDIRWQPFEFQDQAYEQYRQSRDVFGDGSLVLVPMAGHTEGSVGLFINVGGARYFLTGDTSWALEGFTRPAHKFFMMRNMVDSAPDRLDAEIAGVHQLMQREPALTVIPAHDMAAYPAAAVYPSWIGQD